jgi:pimeloyl-ACP methyl ester carboxylesterase
MRSGRADVAEQIDDTLARWMCDPVADNAEIRYVRAALKQGTAERRQAPRFTSPVLALAGVRDVASPPAMELIARSVPTGKSLTTAPPT